MKTLLNYEEKAPVYAVIIPCVLLSKRRESPSGFHYKPKVRKTPAWKLCHRSCFPPFSYRNLNLSLVAEKPPWQLLHRPSLQGFILLWTFWDHSNCNSMIYICWLFLTCIFPSLPTSNSSPRFSKPSSETYLTFVAMLHSDPTTSALGQCLESPSCQCCSILTGLRLSALVYCFTFRPRAHGSSLFPEGAI